MTTTAITMLDPDDGPAELLDLLLKYATRVDGTRVALVHCRGAYDHNDAVAAAALRAGTPITGNGARWTLGNGSSLTVRRVTRLTDAHAEAGAEFAAIGFDELGTLEPVAVDYLLARLRVTAAEADALEAAGLPPCTAYATTAQP